MEYVVLARKLRPSRFADLIGQETVARILQNAIRTDRVAHAFLFAGSRGVGKTSTARILTKLLNCDNPRDAEPCNACPNCDEITNNASPDVYEIDAASNRGIDNIRELRENLKYAPVKCRYTTYIIDEAHMLTPESFNALLKTLEEPPPHVKFILATTSPHKIPETILSRCQRFDFPRIPVPVMTDHLVRVTEQEGISISRGALETIARNAAGGMRDALTALDQAVSYAGPEIPDEQVLQILGLMDNREVLTLLGAVLDKRLAAALDAFAVIVERGHDLQVLLESILREVKDLSLFLALGGRNPYFQDHPPDTLRFYEEKRNGTTLDELQQRFGLFLELEGQLKLTQLPRACFEMALVKACQVSTLVGVPELLSQVRGLLGAAPERHSPARGTSSGAGPAAPSAGGAGSTRAAGLPSEGPPPTGTARAADGTQGDGAADAAPASTEEPSASQAPGRVVTPSGGEAPATPADGAEPRAAPAAPGGAPVEDPRWEGLIERVKAAGKRTLAHHLRRVRVVALDEEHVELVPPDGMAADAIRAEREWLAASVGDLFGDAFHIRINHDKKGEELGQSVIERDHAAERARGDALRADAEQDQAVQAIRRLFPQARVESIQVPPPDRK